MFVLNSGCEAPLPVRVDECCYRRAAGASAMAAQFVAAAEIHWSCSPGKPLSKYGWTGIERVFTYHDPSSNCVFSRNRVPRW